MTRQPTVKRRLWQSIDLVGYLLGILVIVFVVNYFAQQPWLRARVDATKTRAYSLSEQTKQMLSSLTGDWSIALVMIESRTERPVRKQVDEVLGRFADTAPSLAVTRVDPTDPEALPEYERLITRLRGIYADLIARYDVALDDGVAAFAELQMFAQQQAPSVQQIAAALPEDQPARANLAGRGQLMAMLAQQGGVVLEEVERARTVTEARPIADYDTARSILAEGIREWSQQLHEVARTLEDLKAAPPNMIRAFDDEAQVLANAGDPLRRLPPLELSQIGRRLQEGEAAIVIGPDRAAVIPSQQLLPRTNLQNTGTGVSFDQRFRGEQLIASAIRSLQVEQMPMVVFMHAEPESLARPHEADVDLVGVWSLLDASRFEVVEWRVTADDRPEPKRGQDVVWVVIPRIKPQGLSPGEDEVKLVDETKRLIEAGESVLLSQNPNQRHRFGRPDPWSDVPRPMGLVADTSAVVHEARRVSEEDMKVERGQVVRDYPPGHLVAEAMHGQPAYFGLPVPVRMIEEHAGAVRHDVIAAIEADENRWLGSDLHKRPETIQPPAADARLSEPVAVVMAAQRTHPDTGRTQRMVHVGSGGWMLSMTADLAVNVSGDRYALLYPGNSELLLASVHWLAGLDELIAPSPAGREVDRLENLADGTRRRWMWFNVAIMPALCLAAGFVVWFRRR